MAEIKSTLDLVMEKTRNLTLSSEEKQAQKQIDIGNRIKGLVQKFEDGLLTGNQLKRNYDSFKKDADLPDDSLLASGSASLERIVAVTTEPVEYDGARRVDASGKTVLPGLIDAHVHFLAGGAAIVASAESPAGAGSPPTLPDGLTAFCCWMGLRESGSTCPPTASRATRALSTSPARATPSPGG